LSGMPIHSSAAATDQMSLPIGTALHSFPPLSDDSLSRDHRCCRLVRSQGPALVCQAYRRSLVALCLPAISRPFWSLINTPGQLSACASSPAGAGLFFESRRQFHRRLLLFPKSAQPTTRATTAMISQNRMSFPSIVVTSRRRRPHCLSDSSVMGHLSRQNHLARRAKKNGARLAYGGRQGGLSRAPRRLNSV
jgi:hypothetical protein